LFVTLRHIEEVIQPPEKCLILTDNLSSVKALLSRKTSHRTHSLVFGKQMCNDPLEHSPIGEVEIIWIPSLVKLEGNELVGERAHLKALHGTVFERPLPPVDFQGLAIFALLREWQEKLNAADTGRFTHSILLV
jgi:hypothetical protein